MKKFIIALSVLVLLFMALDAAHYRLGWYIDLMLVIQEKSHLPQFFPHQINDFPAVKIAGKGHKLH